MPRRQPTRPTPRRRRVWIALIAAFVIVLGASGIVVWRLNAASSAGTSTQRTVTVSEQTIKETVGTTGTVEPRHRADLSFSSSGTITHVYVGVGDKVSKGERLAAIDDDELRADLTAAKADYQAAQDDQATTQDNADSTDAELKAASSKVVAQRSKVRQARAAVKAAILRSTIKGTVAEVDIAKGDSVGSSTGSSGTGSSGTGSSGTGSSGGSDSSASADVTVISTSSYTVSTSVGSSDLSKIKKGLQAEIITTGSTEPFYGTVSSVAVMASSSTATTSGSAGSATFDVTIDVTGHPSKLYAGATATVSIIVRQRDNVLTVPTAAISTSNGKTTVDKLVDGKGGRDGDQHRYDRRRQHRGHEGTQRRRSGGHHLGGPSQREQQHPRPERQPAGRTERWKLRRRRPAARRWRPVEVQNGQQGGGTR